MEAHNGTAASVTQVPGMDVQRAAHWKVNATGERLGHGVIGHRANRELLVVGCARGRRYSRPC
jgi:hypothetical protein